MGLADKYGYRVVFLLMVLLSGCDIFNTPIRPFIDFQTGRAMEITAFIITGPVTAAGTISGTDITVTVPYGTTVTKIAPQITHTGVSISPASGAPQNFTNPVTYRVTAANGSTRDYRVTVTTSAVPAAGDVAYLTSTGTFYTTLQDAVNASSGTAEANPDTIVLCADIDITSTTTITIDNGKHVKLIAGDTARAINRGASGFNNLIEVDSGCSLELGGDLPLAIDGKKNVPYTATAALIIVSGTFKISSGLVTLTNNNSSGSGGGGGVFVQAGGTFIMSGGSITGNTAVSGGGVHVNGGGRFTMSGGSIAGNNITSGYGESLYKINIGTAKYGGSWGTEDILVSGNMYTDQPLPYDDGSGGYKDPAP
ncbi:hypothetical protein FACS1894140_2630 [Spirochaetia bacterium]|nr:hypothetical protein FACS1894140_2630 [Spirochaetia bacterium]